MNKYVHFLPINTAVLKEFFVVVELSDFINDFIRLNTSLRLAIHSSILT